MEKVEERTSLECLQEEIRVFKKNEEATYDMLALYELLLQDRNIHNLIGTSLTERVIHDFEDSEVTISYRGNNINDMLNLLTDKFYEILRKYKENEECKECCNDFNTSYKEFIAQNDISSLHYRKESIKFNLIKDLLNKSPQFVYKFLVSDIPFDTRLNMLAYVLGSYKSNGFHHFLNGAGKDYLSKEEYHKVNIKVSELLEAFNRGECRICKVQDLINHLVEDNEYGLISQLQDYGIDFNTCYWKYSSKSEELANKTISTVGVLFNRTYALSSIKDSYEADSYLNVDKIARKNNDLLILNYISSGELCDFIKLAHFEVTEEKVRFLASSQMKTIEDECFSYLNVIKNEFKTQNQEIADTIIRKSKNKEEYKKMTEYANLFMELTDIDKLIVKKKKEQERETQDKLLLEKKRQEFSTLLYNMNEYAQENVPPRTLIKNIQFGE